jgi:hypothetical protein
MASIAWGVLLSLSLVWLVVLGYRLVIRNRLGTSLPRRRLGCPAMEQEAEVEFLARDGVPYAVSRCSIIGDLEINCGKRCIETAIRAA